MMGFHITALMSYKTIKSIHTHAHTNLKEENKFGCHFYIIKLLKLLCFYAFLMNYFKMVINSRNV